VAALLTAPGDSAPFPQPVPNAAAASAVTAANSGVATRLRETLARR
jgi:hypothetical protein